jgi:hypothetical protein
MYPDAGRASTADKLIFMGFYEELAVMINSRLLTADLAYWTIGVDAAKFFEKENSWHGDKTWTLFNSFALQAAARQNVLSTEEIARLGF